MKDLGTKIEKIHNAELFYQEEKALIDTAVATAHQYPRDLQRCIANAISTVTIDEKTAQTCLYALPRGGKIIEGKSVHLARVIFQVYGNLRAESKIFEITDKEVVSHSIAWDLESNNAVKVETRRSIMQNEWIQGKKTGNKIIMNDDLISMTANAANAISFRNAIYSVIPKAISDNIYSHAMNKITGDLNDTEKLFNKAKEVFKSLHLEFQLTEKEVFSTIGKETFGNLQQKDIVVLIGLRQAMRDGDIKPDCAFNRRKKKEKPTAADFKDDNKVNGYKLRKLKSLIKKNIAIIPKDSKAYLDRIVNKKETDSYDKGIEHFDELIYKK